MSLEFDPAAVEYVSWPAHASIDTLDPMCWACWVKVASHINNAGLFQKQATAGRPRFVTDTTSADGNLKLSIFQSTSAASYVTNLITPMVTGKWYFVAGVYRTLSTPRIAIYIGDLTTPAIEARYDGSESDGSGTRNVDSANILTVGSRNETTAVATLDGQIAWHGVYNDFFTLAQIRQIQFRARAIGTCGLFCHLGLNDGTGTQRDWSGNGHAGTVVGAGVTEERHPPLPFPLWLPRRGNLMPQAATAGFIPYPPPRGVRGGMLELAGGRH